MGRVVKQQPTASQITNTPVRGKKRWARPRATPHTPDKQAAVGSWLLEALLKGDGEDGVAAAGPAGGGCWGLRGRAEGGWG